jgi:FkbM family methyltransferase
MSSLYFLGIRKSTIKKIPPFKFLFDYRDRQVHSRVLAELAKKYKITSTGAGEMVVEYPLNGKQLSLHVRDFPSSDLSVLNQVYEHKAYAPIIEKMKSCMSPDSTLKVIDAGANVGFSVLYFSAFFPNAQIVAVEPEKSNIQRLKKNVAANNVKLARLIEGALWNKQAFLEVVRDFRDNREASFTVRETSKSELQGYGFNQILSEQGWTSVDLVKIDIEGGERFLFDTEQKADEILTRTKFLAIEIHDEFNIRDTIYRHLQRNGFEYFEYDDLTLAINPKP